MSEIKDLQNMLKNMQGGDQELDTQVKDYLKASKHALLALATLIENLTDLEKAMKDTKKSVQERNAMLDTEIVKVVKPYLDASQKVRKFQHRITPVVLLQFQDWERLESNAKSCKIKKAQ